MGEEGVESLEAPAIYHFFSLSPLRRRSCLFLSICLPEVISIPSMSLQRVYWQKKV